MQLVERDLTAPSLLGGSLDRSKDTPAVSCAIVDLNECVDVVGQQSPNASLGNPFSVRILPARWRRTKFDDGCKRCEALFHVLAEPPMFLLQVLLCSEKPSESLVLRVDSVLTKGALKVAVQNVTDQRSPDPLSILAGIGAFFLPNPILDHAYYSGQCAP